MGALTGFICLNIDAEQRCLYLSNHLESHYGQQWVIITARKPSVLLSGRYLCMQKQWLACWNLYFFSNLCTRLDSRSANLGWQISFPYSFPTFQLYSCNITEELGSCLELQWVRMGGMHSPTAMPAHPSTGTTFYISSVWHFGNCSSGELSAGPELLCVLSLKKEMKTKKWTKKWKPQAHIIFSFPSFFSYHTPRKWKHSSAFLCERSLTRREWICSVLTKASFRDSLPSSGAWPSSLYQWTYRCYK